MGDADGGATVRPCRIRGVNHTANRSGAAAFTTVTCAYCSKPSSLIVCGERPRQRVSNYDKLSFSFSLSCRDNCKLIPLGRELPSVGRRLRQGTRRRASADGASRVSSAQRQRSPQAQPHIHTVTPRPSTYLPSSTTMLRRCRQPKLARRHSWLGRRATPQFQPLSQHRAQPWRR